MSKGFLAYKLSNLTKVNAQRRALSQPDIYTVPILTKSQVMFVSAGEIHNEPASCYNCHFFNFERSCMLMGPSLIIKKLIYPKEPTADAKPIEYWPCCGMQDYGEPNYGVEAFHASDSPDSLGLGWINAPKIGQEQGGANCGGSNGGDDCDHYMTESDDKRSEPNAFCRVLQQPVSNGDVCSAWMDDDWLSWELAQNIFRDTMNPSKDSGAKIVNAIS